MTDDRPSPPADDGAVPLAARAAAAERRAASRAATGVADLMLGRRDRLDDATRAAAAAWIDAATAAIAAEVTDMASRRLPDPAVLRGADVAARIEAAGLTRDPALVAEAIAQARVDAIEAALVATRPPTATATLLSRLLEAGDRIVRARATAYLVADNRRRQAGGEVPEALHRRLAWAAAAVLRAHVGAQADAALAEAAERSLSARRDSGDAAGAAMQLAVAIDAPSVERPHLLIDALAEGRLGLFSALLAHALSIGVDDARALAIDGDGERLWLALRAAGVGRDDIARIGWALCAADRARDVERLPEQIDAIADVTPQDAAVALDLLSLPADYRAAIRALNEAAA